MHEKCNRLAAQLLDQKVKEQSPNRNAWMRRSRSTGYIITESSNIDMPPELKIDDDQWQKLSIEERDKLRRQQESFWRKEQQRIRNEEERKKIEMEKQQRVEEFKRKKSFTSLPNLNEDSNQSESLYETEERVRREQLQKLAENKPVNESSHPVLKGFDFELANKVTSFHSFKRKKKRI